MDNTTNKKAFAYFNKIFDLPKKTMKVIEGYKDRDKTLAFDREAVSEFELNFKITSFLEYLEV